MKNTENFDVEGRKCQTARSRGSGILTPLGWPPVRAERCLPPSSGAWRTHPSSRAQVSDVSPRTLTFNPDPSPRVLTYTLPRDRCRGVGGAGSGRLYGRPQPPLSICGQGAPTTGQRGQHPHIPSLSLEGPRGNPDTDGRVRLCSPRISSCGRLIPARSPEGPWFTGPRRGGPWNPAAVRPLTG